MKKSILTQLIVALIMTIVISGRRILFYFFNQPIAEILKITPERFTLRSITAFAFCFLLMNNGFSQRSQTKRRLLNLLYFVVFVLISFYLMCIFSYGQTNVSREFWTSFSRYAWMWGILALILKFVRMNEKKLRAQLEKERIQKEIIKLELSTLKDHLAPHFFFNALNNLNSLIRKNPPKAITYNEQLSRTFRYILTQKNNTFVPLQQEIDFVEDYIKINQQRFGYIDYEIDVPLEQLNKFIPVFSLQILIENCIKHNRIAETFPLEIHITVKDEQLLVSNTLSPKEKVKNTYLGHQSINKTYLMYGENTLAFEQDTRKFHVYLPLIQSPKLCES